MIYPLYIDPGTGSAIFSIVIGAAAAVYFLSQALWIKIKVLITGGRLKENTKDHHPFVIYAEDKRYWNVFKPVVEEFEKRKKQLLYLTSSKDDPVFDANYHYTNAQYIGEGNKAFSRLNFLNADFVLMTTPGLDVYQIKRSRNVKHYSHLLHAPGGTALYRMFALDYYDSVLLTNDREEEKEEIRSLEIMRGLSKKQLVCVGCTYLDVLADKLIQIPKEDNHPFTVLVSPTWGENGLLMRYGKKLLDPLVETGFRIIVRPHPQSKISENAMLVELTKHYDEKLNLQWDYERDNMIALSKSDIMISDYSGIIFDYAFLFDKPVMSVKANFDLAVYDAYFLEKKTEYLHFQDEIVVELCEEDFPRICGVIKQVIDSTQLQTVRKKVKELVWQHQGEAGKRVADFMIEWQLNHTISP